MSGDESKRKKRELIIICSLLILIPIVLYYVSRSLRWNIELSVKHKILVFTLINVNVILILLLLYLIFRNLVKLFLQKKKGLLGTKLRIKLVVAFMILSLFPTVILFVASAQYISSSVDYWFSRQIDKAINDANEMSINFLKFFRKKMADEINVILQLSENKKENSLIDLFYPISSSFTFDRKDDISVSVVEVRSKSEINASELIEYLVDAGCLGPKECDFSFVRLSGETVLFIGKKFNESLIVFTENFPALLESKIENVSSAYLQYSNLESLRFPIKSGYIISLGIVSLLVLFTSMWFGMYVSREITVPIQALAEATKRISVGDYDFDLQIQSKDEIGVLVNSFNRMTKEIKQTKKEIEEANQELKERNKELTKQNQYIEFVINNIGAGVLSIDREGKISTFNLAAKKMFDIQSHNLAGMLLEDVVPPLLLETIKKELSKRQGFRKQLKFAHEGRAMNLLVTVNSILDEKGESLGIVAVFEDLMEVERAERMEAWQEVARRIAHEVKNPLTPIQLSAQRLNKRLLPLLNEKEAQLVGECTGLILSQVEELKRLVGEFSMFARMPRSLKVPMRLDTLLKEVLEVFRERHKEIIWKAVLPENGILVRGDREQLRRAITNILNNAVEAAPKEGEIFLSVSLYGDKVSISIEDSGPGIPPEFRHKVFEPYFSTKSQGGGLGLAISHSIIEDHHGEIWVEDSRLGGARVRIELPLERDS